MYHTASTFSPILVFLYSFQPHDSNAELFNSFLSMDTEEPTSLELQYVTPDTKRECEDQPHTRVESSQGDSKYPSGVRLLSICIGLCLSVFLVALDNTIIATAIPKITDDFKALDAVGWYASAYLLTTCAFQLLFGTLYRLFPIKQVFLVAIAVFEIGSAVCGAAPNSTALIIGRAISGLGSAGVFSGALVIIAHCVPLERRPIYNGILLSMFGLASVAGPLLGGAFTDYVSWRWCFYINLPIGAVTILSILLFLKLHTQPRSPAEPTSRKQNILAQFDILGTTMFIPAIVCLLLALQWGGAKYSWSNGRIIALLTSFGVLIIAFCIIQVWKREAATVPPRIICQRSMIFGASFSFLLGGSYFIMVYFIPIWFQAIKEVSATKSGIMCIPMILAVVIFSLLSGIVITITGHYVPFFYLSVIFSATGAGLLTTFSTNTGAGEWIGYQVLYGTGIGLGFQLAVVSSQVVLDQADLPVGMALIVFFQSLGGAIFTSVGESVFLNELVKSIQRGAPGVDASLVLNAGATELRTSVPSTFVPIVQSAFNHALTHTWYVSTALSALSILGSLGMEWRTVKVAEGMNVMMQA